MGHPNVGHGISGKRGRGQHNFGNEECKRSSNYLGEANSSNSSDSSSSNSNKKEEEHSWIMCRGEEERKQLCLNSNVLHSPPATLHYEKHNLSLSTNASAMSRNTTNSCKRSVFHTTSTTDGEGAIKKSKNDLSTALNDSIDAVRKHDPKPETRPKSIKGDNPQHHTMTRQVILNRKDDTSTNIPMYGSNYDQNAKKASIMSESSGQKEPINGTMSGNDANTHQIKMPRGNSIFFSSTGTSSLAIETSSIRTKEKKEDVSSKKMVRPGCKTLDCQEDISSNNTFSNNSSSSSPSSYNCSSSSVSSNINDSSGETYSLNTSCLEGIASDINLSDGGLSSSSGGHENGDSSDSDIESKKKAEELKQSGRTTTQIVDEAKAAIPIQPAENVRERKANGCRNASDVLKEALPNESKMDMLENKYQVEQTQDRGIIVSSLQVQQDSSITQLYPLNVLDAAEVLRFASSSNHPFQPNMPLHLNYEHLKHLESMFSNSQESQKKLKEWDKTMGLHCGHSHTMNKSARSRKKVHSHIKKMLKFFGTQE